MNREQFLGQTFSRIRDAIKDKSIRIAESIQGETIEKGYVDFDRKMEKITVYYNIWEPVHEKWHPVECTFDFKRLEEDI